jgi:hypothetical protein
MLLALSAFKPHLLYTTNNFLTDEGFFRFSNLPFDLLQIWFSLRKRPKGGEVLGWVLLSATVSCQPLNEGE